MYILGKIHNSIIYIIISINIDHYLLFHICGGLETHGDKRRHAGGILQESECNTNPSLQLRSVFFLFATRTSHECSSTSHVHKRRSCDRMAERCDNLIWIVILMCIMSQHESGNVQLEDSNSRQDSITTAAPLLQLIEHGFYVVRMPTSPVHP